MSDFLLNNITVSIENPQSFLKRWSHTLQQFFLSQKALATQLQQIANNSTDKFIRSHCSAKAKAIVFNLKQYEKYLPWLKELDPIALPNLHTQGKAPDAYLRTLFRDWCWPNNENSLYAQKCSSHFNPGHRVLILGAGACQLASLVAAQNEVEVVAFDSNPLIMGLASEILEGKKIKLFDFPENSTLGPVVKQELSSAIITSSNLQLTLGDFFEMPFQDGQFDVIIAPWFFDILDRPLQNSVHRCLPFLRPEGKLIYLGPANLAGAKEKYKLYQTEIIQIWQDFFEETESSTFESSYLFADYDGQKRMESQLFLVGKSKRDRKDFQRISSELSEDDILKNNELLSFHQKKNEALSNILKHFQAETSFESSVKKVAAEFGLSFDQAKSYCLKILHQLY